MEETTKVNFVISKKNKAVLDKIKKEIGMNNSAVVDTLLSFDDNAAELFLETFKKLNPKKVEKYNYLRLSNGGVVYKNTVMEKIIDSNISLLSKDEAIQNGIKSIEKKYNEDDIDEEIAESLSERLEIAEKALLSIHREFLKQQLQIQELLNNSSDGEF